MAEELFGGKDFNKAISELEKAFEDKSAFRKFIDTVKEILSRIKEALGGSASVDALERNIVKLQKQIDSREAVKGPESKPTNSADNKESRYERTDEFRKLQAESKRMSEKDIQLYHSGNRQIDERIRGRLSRSVQEIFLGTDDNGVSNAKGLLSLSAKNNTFEIYQDVNAELFHDVFEIARNYLKFGELVDLHEVNTTDEGIGYKDCLNYLSKDGLSGFSITPDGDLISVFNASGKSGFLRAIAPVVKEKAKTLDCYASKEQNLQSMYTAIFNFKTASVMDYNMEYDHDNIAENHGKPQVAFMVNTESEVETRHFTKDQYDEAVEYRNSFVEKKKKYSVEDEELKGIISRLNNNESVSIEEINANEQIKKARAKADSIPTTNTINTAERKKLRQSITDKLLENGSYTGVDENGKEVYNGNIKTERRIDLVIGVPAAGKSSVLVNPLSEQYQSRVVDSDMAKELLPEFNNGLGANAVHKESQNIIDEVLYKALVNGENIVHPIVGGGKLESLVDKISYFKEKGYSVYLHLNELPINKSVGRAINRFIETGRFIPPEVLFDYQDKPTQNFNRLKEREDLIDGYSHYSNDVRKGERPKLIEASEGVQLLFGRGQRRSERTKSSRTEIQSKSEAGLENSAFSNGEKKYSIDELSKEQKRKLATALYTVNKHAKQIRDAKRNIYENKTDGAELDENTKRILKDYANLNKNYYDNTDKMSFDTKDGVLAITVPLDWIEEEKSTVEDLIEERENLEEEYSVDEYGSPIDEKTIDDFESEEEYEEYEDDLEYCADNIETINKYIGILEDEQDIIEEFQRYESNIEDYDRKHEVISKLNINPVAYHEFADGAIRALYQIDDFTFHSDDLKSEEIPDNAEITEIDNSYISAENKLESKMSYEEANEIINGYLSEKDNTDSDTNSEVKFSVDDDIVDRYTEKQYNNFGWVRANDVLTPAEYQHFTHEYANYKKLNNKPFGYNPTTKEAVIPTGKDLNTLNVYVYARGDIDSPEITKVVRINATDTTDLKIIKEFFQENERDNNQEAVTIIEKVYGNEVVEQFTAENFGTFREFTARRTRNISGENTENTRFDNGRKGNRKQNATDSEAGLENSAFSNGEKYSYDELTSKPDMKIATLSEVSDTEYKKYRQNTSLFAKDMVAIARKENNSKNTATATYLHNDDTNSDIMVAKTSFEHGATRIDKQYIEVSKKLPSILKNAIAVNELVPRENSNGTKVFIGMAEYNDNYVFVRMVVDNRTQNLNDYDILYAIKKSSIKKEEAGTMPAGLVNNNRSATPSIISISDLLKNVKDVKLVNSVLSKDVLDNLGIERPDSVFKDSLKYSADEKFDELNEKYGTIKKGVNAERDIDTPKQTSEKEITSFTVRSILEKGNIDGLSLEWIKESVIDEAQSHKVYSDEQALEYAQRHLENGDALQIWQDAVSGKATKNDIAIGSALLEMYAKMKCQYKR